MKNLQQTKWQGIGSGIAALVLAAATAVQADTIEMKDGKLVQGLFVGGTQATVRFQTPTAIKVIPITEILAVTFDRTTPAATAAAAAVPAAVTAAAATATTAAAAATTAVTAQVATAAQAAAAIAGQPAATVTAALPAKPSLVAGSKIQVRIIETMDSATQKAGAKFTGVLTTELRAGDVVLAPAGAPVAGELAVGTAPQPALLLVLTGITVNDQIKPVTTDDVTAISAPLTKKNLKSSAFGAALGAIAGGSDGALKAAGASALAAVLVKGDSVTVPASSVLEFQLKTAFTP